MKKVIFLFLSVFAIAMCSNTNMAQASTSSISATIDANDSSKVHLRANPSIEAASLGLYFTGAEVYCDTDSPEGWTKVVIGSETGYIKSEYLRWENDRDSVLSQQPIGVAKTKSWINLRSMPGLQAEQIGKLYDGDTMVIHGETVSHWYYVTVNGLSGYVKTEYVHILNNQNPQNGSGKPPAHTGTSSNTPANPQRVIERIDPQGSLEAHVIASYCNIALIPTDDSVVTCEYDASALRFAHSIDRGAHILSLENTRTFSASSYPFATIYLPKNYYHQFYLDVTNGEGSIAGGFQCYSIVYGNNARFSLTFAANNTYGYEIGLANSVCIMGVSEAAKDFSITVENIVNSSIMVQTYSMPSFQPGAVSYKYTNGTNVTQVNVTSLRNSNLEFTYVK